MSPPPENDGHGGEATSSPNGPCRCAISSGSSCGDVAVDRAYAGRDPGGAGVDVDLDAERLDAELAGGDVPSAGTGEQVERAAVRLFGVATRHRRALDNGAAHAATTWPQVGQRSTPSEWS